MKFFNLKKCLLFVTAICVAGTSFAQYVWTDEKGIKQYSDQPPPSNIPQNRILKAPKGATMGIQRTQEASSSLNQENGPMSTAEKNADFIKRRTEQAEKDKKAADEANLAASKMQNCDRAREYQRLLDSGQRIASATPNGERRYLSDEDRARDSQNTRRILEGCR